jgi:hypothetical protein
MVKVEILKLRESEASTKQSNADFKVELNRTLKLCEGDELNIKSVYLDTIASGGELIELDDDVALEMEMVRYLVNQPSDQTYPAPNAATRMKEYVPANATASANGDGELYVACKRATTPANVEKVKKVEYNVPHRSNRMVGGLTLQFSYTRIDGTTGTHSIRIKREKANFYPKDGKEEDVGIKIAGESFVLTSPSREVIKKHGIDPASVNIVYETIKPNVGEEVAEPIIYKFSMTIPKGVYAPTQLGALITDKMTEIDSSGQIGSNPAGGLYAVNNPFLGTIIQQTQAEANLFFCRADGGQLIRYNQFAVGQLAETANQDRFLGASQVSLGYDTDHKKMEFSILHTPIYVGATGAGNDALPGLEYTTYGIDNKYSGVAFTSLSPATFWTKLGLDNITTNYTSSETIINDVGGIIGANVFPITMALVEGENITGGFESIDTPVQKNADFRNPHGTGEVATNATEPLFGDVVFLNNYANEGYYFVELTLGVQQSLVGGYGSNGFNSSKIHSVVGTYFQNNNYTSDNGVGSIPYIHKGEDVMISGVGVRILNAEGQVPADNEIGEHNTIFLQLTKQDAISQKQ